MSQNCNNTSETESCQSNRDPSTDGACPIEEFTQAWEASFCQAMKQTMITKLQERIEAQWGEMIGQEADALVETMSAKWGTKIAAVQAKQSRDAFKQTLVTNWLATAKG